MPATSPCHIRRLLLEDVHLLLSIIRDTRREYGLENRVAQLLEPSDYLLFDLYSRRRAAYFVAIDGGEIAGGAGIAPLAGGDFQTCELQRMYLRPASRGRGAGQLLLDACIRAAQSMGFNRCYAETVSAMSSALAFYERNGFKRLDTAHGRTGHGHSDCWLMLDIPTEYHLNASSTTRKSA